MCFEGSLDDFSIQDILQIVASGRKSGCLSLDTPLESGGIVFRSGRIIAWVENGEPTLVPNRRQPARPEDAALDDRLATFVARLARCRQGGFSFEASGEPRRLFETHLGLVGMPRPGIEVVELLIEVADRARSEEGVAELAGSPAHAVTAAAATPPVGAALHRRAPRPPLGGC